MPTWSSGVESDVISLANGCVCCTIRDDLLSTVIDTMNRPEQPEYILLEASGVAEPASIAMTFNNLTLRDRIRLDRSSASLTPTRCSPRRRCWS